MSRRCRAGRGGPEASPGRRREAKRFRWYDPLRLGAYKDVRRGVTMRFHYGRGRSPLSMTLADGRGEREYRLGCDPVGTLKAVADGEGNLIKAMQYDSFGGPIHDTAPSLYIPIGFGGGLRDRHTGLVRFVNRDYDPRTGRFTAPDPMGDTGGDHDLYEYCVDDPINAEDPWGLEGGMIPGAEDVAKGVKKAGAASTRLDGLFGTSKAYEEAYETGDELEERLSDCMEHGDASCLDEISEQRSKAIAKGSSNAFFKFLKAVTGSTLIDVYDRKRELDK